MTTESKLKQLEDILKARLPLIDRWNKVQVYTKGDSFIIEWSEPKGGNTNNPETKEAPLSDLDLLIKRNTERLYNSVKQYK